ncbi:hypothetical protein CYMTET_33785, partial [Cymbomonas tetramitiformis]
VVMALVPGAGRVAGGQTGVVMALVPGAGRVAGGQTGVVMALVPGTPLGKAHDFDSVLRGRYPADKRASVSYVLECFSGLAAGLHWLHSHGIAHGDVFAHNLMVSEEGSAVLLDFGAAFFYDPDSEAPYSKCEIRAFGLLLKDMEERSINDEYGVRPAIRGLVQDCLLEEPAMRPTFAQAEERLNEMKQMLLSVNRIL